MAEKFIESPESIQYKKQHGEFQKMVNPKPFTLEEVKEIKQELLKKREQK